MELETTISKSIRTADDRANYDAACKRLLSEKIILAWIVKSCVEEFRDCDVKDIASRYIEGEPQVSEVPVMPDETNAATVIHGINTEDASQTEGTVTYDIRFLASLPSSSGKIRMILNVEGQNNFHPGYPIIKRGIYYCSRMISAQYGTEFVAANYSDIKKVASIWVCMKPPKGRENTITSYSITEKNLIGTVEEPVENYDLMTAVMICLGGSNSRSEPDVLRLLDVLFSSETGAEKKRHILQQDFDIPMTQTLERKVDVMCNFSQGVWEQGMEAGRKEGVEAGRKEGMEAGRKEGLEAGAMQNMLNSIKNLLKNTGWPIEQVMSMLGVPDADRPKYLEALKGHAQSN